MVRKTFRHERQVQAEAEARIIVEKLSDHIFKVDGNQAEDSYFISNTRAIDQVKTPSLPVTMRPSSMLLMAQHTHRLPNTAELSGFVSARLWEAAENGLITYARTSRQQAGWAIQSG